MSTTELTRKERDEILNEMTPVAQEAAIQGANRLCTGFQVMLLTQYDIGMLVNTVYEDEELNETQRRQEIKRLAAYWNHSNLQASTLYDLRNVAAAFDREFIKEQSAEPLSNGNFLTWSHFKELQKLQPNRQLAVLKKVRQHAWSANELALEIQGKRESKVSRQGGRKPTLPKTPNGMLQKLFTTVQQTDNYVTAIDEPLGGAFLEIAPDECDEDFLRRVEDTLTRMEETGQHIQSASSKLKKVRDRAQKVIAKRGQAALEAKSESEPPQSRPTGKRRVSKAAKASSGKAAKKTAKKTSKLASAKRPSKGAAKQRKRPRRSQAATA